MYEQLDLGTKLTAHRETGVCVISGFDAQVLGSTTIPIRGCKMVSVIQRRKSLLNIKDVYWLVSQSLSIFASSR